MSHAEGSNLRGGRQADADEARAWLREALAAGPRLAKELRQEASERGIGRSALYAARKAEDITIAKERITYGRWFWGFSNPCGEREDEREGERTREDVGLPGS